MTEIERKVAQTLAPHRERERIFHAMAEAISEARIPMRKKADLLEHLIEACVSGPRRVCLEKELKEAERAAAEDPSEQNFAWLESVRCELRAA